MLKYIVSFLYDKYLKLSLLVRTGVTEVNSTNSRAKFIHVVFSFVFIGIVRLFGTKYGYFLHIGALKLYFRLSG